MYDVGTDHAYLPCYVVAEGIVGKAYAGDNKTGPLKNAQENIRELGEFDGQSIYAVDETMDGKDFKCTTGHTKQK